MLRAMNKILVTGATGFIGNHVIGELLKNNYSVIATSANKEKAKNFSWFSLVDYIPFNFDAFEDIIDYRTFFREPDNVVHLAWEGLPNYKSSFHYEKNLPRHFSFLKNLIQNGVKDLTVTGTCLEYGLQNGELNEAMPTAPANPYALAKDILRKSLQELQIQRDFNLKWVRLFYMYGKGQNPNSLSSQLDKAIAQHDEVFNMSDGEQLRDFLSVEKVAEYIVKIALQNKVTGIINCCSGRPVSVKQFVNNYLEEKNAALKLNLGYYPYPDYEPMAFWGNDKKLKKIIAK
jgi:dTDP-6-deoxy-L-talose 4-dehydrogenase (NAD+)